MINELISFDSLKRKERTNRDVFPGTMRLRVHRAISWVGGAEKCGEDNDARFIFLWIAFNATYAGENKFQANNHREHEGERATFQEFFEKLVNLDSDNRIYNAIWERFSGPVRTLMNNHYVFNPFWQYHNDVNGFNNWCVRFEKSVSVFNQAFEKKDTAQVLSHVFDRLYVLRNQLVHGGSTWNSSVNREQVRDGSAVLAFLMPVFVDIMMDNPAEDWGKPFYPVVD